MTILAPTNDAFKNMSGEDMKDVLLDPSKAKALLERHILDKVYSYDELAAATEVKTVGGDTLAVTSDGDTIKIAGAVVSKPDTDQLSGEAGQEIAVFAIDHVLTEGG